MPRMDVSRFGEQVQVRVGSEAIGAKANADAATQELAKWMRRMAEGRVRARAEDDRAVPRDARSRGEMVAVDEQFRLAEIDSLHGRAVRCKRPGWIPGIQLLQELGERPAVVMQQFDFTRPFGKV